MNAETIKLQQKAESFKPILEEAGFGDLQYFWYSDGLYRGYWKDMSVALDRPEDERDYVHWQFGFKTQHKENKRVHLKAILELFDDDDYFRLDLKYFPEVTLHDREGFLGPTMSIEIGDILEQDLKDLKKYVRLLTDRLTCVALLDGE